MNLKKTLLTTFLIIISFLGVESSLLAYKPARESARQKSCFSNQRVLLGAVEMYHMDNSKPIGTTLPGRDFEDLENMLIDLHYIKETLDRPEEDCSYGLIVTDPEKYDYVIFCKKHGTIETSDYEKPIIPSYDKSLEKPFSIEFKNLMAKRNQQKRRYKLIGEILSSPLLSYSIIIIAVILCIAISVQGKKQKKA